MMDVVVYRSSRVADMYLFVAAADGLTHVPEALLARFGRAEEALRLELTADRKLARSDAPVVLEAIAARGFYLQLPPALDEPFDA
jgi:uncharacterized protein YcgL (UPF0745 family)